MIDKQHRGYAGAALVFIMIIGLLVFLAFYEIPAQNNDAFKLIIGVIVGSLSVVIYTLVGKDPDEVNVLKQENEKLIEQNSQLQSRLNHLEAMFMDLQKSVIDKLSTLNETLS